MGNLLHDWFPDAPMWVPWLAFWLMVGLFLFLLACLLPSPFEKFRNNQVAKEDSEGRGGYVGITEHGKLALRVATPVVEPTAGSHRKED